MAPERANCPPDFHVKLVSDRQQQAHEMGKAMFSYLDYVSDTDVEWF